MDRRFIFFVISVISVILIGLGLRTLIMQKNASLAHTEIKSYLYPDQLEILVAANPLFRGQVIAEGDFRWQSWPNRTLRPTMIVKPTRDLNAFIGDLVRVPMSKGQPLDESFIISHQTTGYLANLLPEGRDAITIPLDDASGHASLIVPGDYVDVYIYDNKNNATVLINHVHVLAIDQNVIPRAYQSRADSSTIKQNEGPSGTVTLDVSQGDASIIAAAKARDQRFGVALDSSMDALYPKTYHLPNSKVPQNQSPIITEIHGDQVIIKGGGSAR